MSPRCLCVGCIESRTQQTNRNRRRGLRPTCPPVLVTRDAGAGANTSGAQGEGAPDTHGSPALGNSG